jgi:hypothetical protein
MKIWPTINDKFPPQFENTGASGFSAIFFSEVTDDHVILNCYILNKFMRRIKKTGSQTVQALVRYWGMSVGVIAIGPMAHTVRVLASQKRAPQSMAHECGTRCISCIDRPVSGPGSIHGPWLIIKSQVFPLSRTTWMLFKRELTLFGLG